MHRFIQLLLFLLTSISVVASDFVTTDGTHLLRNGQPYYFIGTNFWYAPILASKGEGGDRVRLQRELDTLQRIGIDNLRILVGADRGSCNVTSLTPCLQSEPGVLNDTLLDGLDYLLAEMEQRQITGVFYLTNSWDWSGGYGFYLREAGFGDSPDAAAEGGWEAYCNYASRFYTAPHAQQLYIDYVKRIVGRTNSYTGLPYHQSPAIMAWQLCNEPRPFAPEMATSMVNWAKTTARLIKSLDPNHLVSTGTEGTVGCLWDEKLLEELHADTCIDYVTVHIWPVNWGWAPRTGMTKEDLPKVYKQTKEYLETNIRVAERIRKPIILEEFGFPRDHEALLPGTRTTCRDAFYNFLFKRIAESKQAGGVLAGCNFWGWGGTGRPTGERWKQGDAYVSDPPHEPQGWYCVYDTDRSTLHLLRQAIRTLRR